MKQTKAHSKCSSLIIVNYGKFESFESTKTINRYQFTTKVCNSN